MKKRIIKNTITIHAPALKVWDVLVNPEQTKKYMFGCATISDWKVGNTLLWSAFYEGKDIVFVKGNIAAIDPQKILSYTVFDPFSTMPDIPENYLTVTYKLSEKAGKTILTVTQADYNTVAEGDRRYNEAYNKGVGWQPILVQIKKITES